MTPRSTGIPRTPAAKRRTIRRSALLVIAASAYQPLLPAAAEQPRLEITPLVAYRFGGTFEVAASDASFEIEDSSAHGLILNWRESANTQWELLYSRQTSRAGSSLTATSPPVVDLDLQVLQIGGTYQGDGESLRPYLAATIGGTRIKADADSDTFFSGSIGAGLQFRPTDRVGLRLEARAYGTLTDSDTDLFCRLGGDPSVCAIRIEGDLLGQLEAFAGVVLRF